MPAVPLSAKCPESGPHLGMICLGCISIYIYIWHGCWRNMFVLGGWKPTIWCWLGQLQRLRIALKPQWFTAAIHRWFSHVVVFFLIGSHSTDGYGPVNNQEVTILIFSIPSNLSEHFEGVMLHDLAYQRFNLWFLKQWAVRWAMTPCGVIMNSYCWHAPGLQDGNGWAVLLYEYPPHGVGRCSQVWEVTLSRWDGCMSLDLYYEGCSLVLYRGITCSDLRETFKQTIKLRSWFNSQAKKTESLTSWIMIDFVFFCPGLWRAFAAAKTAKAQLGMFCFPKFALK